MWVRLAEWMVVDNEPVLPVVGAMLPDVGVRISGVLDKEELSAPGIVMVDPAMVPPEVEYRVRGTIAGAKDIFVDQDFGNDAHYGCEFLIDAPRLQLTGEVVGGHAAEFKPGIALTIRGQMEVIAAYEWEDFSLPGLRQDWLVRQVVGPFGSLGDYMLDLEAR